MNQPRTPSEAKLPRMEPLARLPLFYALDGKHALVAGTNAGAVWKVELLSATGARVEVFAEKPSQDLLALANDPPKGAITVHRRAWTDEDFKGCAIAIGGCETDEEGARFAAAARAAGVPVNVIDKPAYCDFAFGAIVNRSPLVLGVSTDGAAPVFGRRSARSWNPFCRSVTRAGRRRRRTGVRKCKRPGFRSADAAASGKISRRMRSPMPTARRDLPISTSCSRARARKTRERIAVRSFSSARGRAIPSF